MAVGLAPGLSGVPGRNRNDDNVDDGLGLEEAPQRWKRCRGKEKRSMITKNTNKGMMLAVFAVVAALVVAAPAIAQQNASGQSAAAQTGAVTLDLATLQRTGPGGDLANVRRASTLGASGSTGSCPEETCYECLLLDSYNPVNTYDPNVPGSALINTVQTANSLTAGQPYLIKITGTVSYWGYTYYTAPIGSPEPHPIFLSPARADRAAGRRRLRLGVPLRVPEQQPREPLRVGPGSHSRIRASASTTARRSWIMFLWAARSTVPATRTATSSRGRGSRRSSTSRTSGRTTTTTASTRSASTSFSPSRPAVAGIS